MHKRVFIFLITLLMSQMPQAGMRQYSVDIRSSEWLLANETRLMCELEHAIPGYGKAKFVSEASKQLNLEFTLDMLRLPSRYDVADVYSKPPAYMRGASQRKLGEMQLRKQYDADLPQDIAWEMLTELEKGFWPTIHYRDWLNSQDSVAVSLNASNFKSEFNAFNECVNNLLPYTFDDIAYTVLDYKKGSSDLTDFSEKRLRMIAEYLREDLDLDLVLVDAYSDGYGADWLNEQLSKKRADEIRSFFASMGLEQNRIEITAHGEKRHVSPNRTAREREQNRRVVIRMSKSS